MAEHADVYTDGATVTMTPVGVTISFTRSQPATPGVIETDNTEIAVRVRMGRPMAEALRDVLQQALSAQPGPQTQTITH